MHFGEVNESEKGQQKKEHWSKVFRVLNNFFKHSVSTICANSVYVCLWGKNEGFVINSCNIVSEDFQLCIQHGTISLKLISFLPFSSCCGQMMCLMALSTQKIDKAIKHKGCEGRGNAHKNVHRWRKVITAVIRWLSSSGQWKILKWHLHFSTSNLKEMQIVSFPLTKVPKGVWCSADGSRCKQKMCVASRIPGPISAPSNE